MEPAKKLSVSVPGDLWKQAQDLGPDLNPSYIVQEAIRRWVGEGEQKPAYSVERPADSESEFKSVRARWVEEARGEFERGYRSGVEVAGHLAWRDLESLAAPYRFNVKRWAKAWAQDSVEDDMRQSGPLPEVAEFFDHYQQRKAEAEKARASEDPNKVAPSVRKMRALIKALGAWVSPYGDDEGLPGPTYVAGFTQAMRDFWKEVNGLREPQEDKQ